jgi:hypothetical protein
MQFLDISSLGATYRYSFKIEQKLKQKTQKFGLGNPSQKNPGKGSFHPQNKGERKYEQYQENQSNQQANKDTKKKKKDTEKWCDFHKIPWHNTNEFRSKKYLVAEVKNSESDAGSNSES